MKMKLKRKKGMIRALSLTVKMRMCVPASKNKDRLGSSFQLFICCPGAREVRQQHI